MTHPFDVYYSRHRHYPRVRMRSGVQEITVTFHPGYMHVKSSAPYSGEVYLTRSAAITFLRKVVPIAKLWKANPDWDVPAAVHQAYLDELALSRELREAKKTRYLPPGDSAEARERKRRRYLAAKARGAGKNRRPG